MKSSKWKNKEKDEPLLHIPSNNKRKKRQIKRQKGSRASKKLLQDITGIKKAWCDPVS